MPKSNLLIRDYDNIRRILRDIYIFGCFSRDDFIEMGISGRKYDNEQRRINAYLPEGFVKKRRVNKKVQYYCSYSLDDEGNSCLGENYLVETYQNKSFTLLDVMSYFYVLGILNENPGLSLNDILDRIPQTNGEISFTKDNLRIKLIELEERGLIQSYSQGRAVKYCLTEDIWDAFTVEELKSIYIYLDFARNAMPLEMPYVFLQRKLRMYLCRKGIADLPEGVFQFKHNHLFNVLDNEIMLELLRAIKSRKSAIITRTGCDETIEVIPLKIIHECTYGRQYLYCVEADARSKDHCVEDNPHPKALMIRLDKIDTVTAGLELNEDEYRAIAGAHYGEEECWCTSGLGERLHRVTIEVLLDESREGYILRRIIREGHGGTVTKRSDGVYEYAIEVRDPLEMIPWIRSFGEHMRVVDDDGTLLKEKMALDWKRAIEKYEAL